MNGPAKCKGGGGVTKGRAYRIRAGAQSQASKASTWRVKISVTRSDHTTRKTSYTHCNSRCIQIVQQRLHSLEHTDTGYRLGYRDSGARFPTEAGNFSRLHPVQTGSGAHLVSYTMRNGGSFFGSKVAGE